MIRKLLLGTSLALSLLSLGCSNNHNTNKNIDESVVKEANSLVAKTTYHLKDLKGNDYTVTKELNGFKLEGAKDMIVIFDVFATWCPPCRAEASHLSHLQKKYKDKLIVIGVSIEDGIQADKLEDFANENDANYALSVSPDNRRLAHAIASAIKAGEQFPIPMMVVYKNGKYITHYVGATPEEMIESDIKQIIGQNK